MSPETHLILLLAAPLAAALWSAIAGAAAGYPNGGTGANWRDGGVLVIAIGAAYLAWKLAFDLHRGAEFELGIAEIAPGVSIGFEAEPLGALFAVVASTLWCVNTLYAIGYMRGAKEKDQTRFAIFVCVSIFGAFGAAMAGDLITLFVFYEILTFATYPLVAHKGGDAVKKGARIYLGVLVAGSVGLLLPAIVWTGVATGGFEFQLGGVLGGAPEWVRNALVVLFAFGIGKAALMPGHLWLPNAMVAPTPVSALLHAVAVVKTGVFAMLKIALYTFGADTLQATPASVWIAAAAAISIVLASVIGWRQNDMKARLAYSTVSQLSYITLGAMIATPFAILGAALHIVMHAAAKITLFMSAGAIYVATGEKTVTGTVGLGRKMPWIFWSFLIGACSIIGLPIFGGVWSKLALMWGGLEASHHDYSWAVLALLVSTALNIAYLASIPARALFAPGALAAQAKPFKTPQGASFALVFPPVLTAVMCAALFFTAPFISAFLEPLWSPQP